MVLIKRKTEYKRKKLESNPFDGVLLHGYIDQPIWQDKPLYEGKIGLSMNDRKHFTKQQWDYLYECGCLMFKEVKNEEKCR